MYMYIHIHMNIMKNIEAIAAREGISAQEVLQEIQTAIDKAWESQDPELRSAQLGLTGRKHAPNPEEFIATIVQRYDIYKG